jgi:hypothetical protein
MMWSIKMMKNDLISSTRWIVFIVLTTCSFSVFSQSKSAVGSEQVLCGLATLDIESADFSSSTLSKNTAYLLCRPWALVPGKRIVLVLMPEPKAAHEDFALDMLVVVSDDKNQILAQLLVPDYVNSDAYRFNGIALDTAAYLLGDEKPAFGVRTNGTGSSNVNPYSANTLSLFVFANNGIRRVLENFDTHVDRGEWDQNCTGHFEKIKRTIQIGPRGKSGFVDLLVKQTGDKRTISPAKSKNETSECTEKEGKLLMKNFSLKYDGIAYIIPRDKMD